MASAMSGALRIANPLVPEVLLDLFGLALCRARVRELVAFGLLRVENGFAGAHARR